ncbi:hypothetical protein KP77_15280 [Jeotgalibacillus alimentarius]|uniref:Thiol-disulfide oxidoreductase n=2 Tax=Jeotgalibacillus TaxID=157226 RepID=A0A0C2W218_9BACL|nr:MULTISPECIES: thiol-disulfide oxidoreductase DCC family protein [Jeotgalibacillus]KIL50153.1 hypothetical protein KP77_15280 [Jeotgalibacillus alimentarius]MBM7579798.1 putative DCC family thiol-disulfide oxidoreductase YuxK [Jeotgalibacillus terrae]
MPAVVLFDGDCNVCDWSVQFIMKHDRAGYFHFASLQGEIGQKMRKTFDVPPMVDSVLLIEDDKLHMKSDAALRICRSLDGPVKLLSLLLIVPRPVRNLAYDAFARNRFHWFGKKQACKLPTPEERRRLLD